MNRTVSLCRLSAVGFVAAFALSACGGSKSEPATQASAASTPPAGSPAAAVAPSAAQNDQVAQGQQLYGQNCAGCHGAAGQGGKAPPVVGKDALPLNPPATAKFRKTQFHTIKDIFDFVKANMPPNAPGKLTDQEYWAILAFDLKANGVDLAGKKLDASSAPGVVLHP